ncbi:MAG TPA: hypothetical protein VL633_08670 [Bacteroidota bacterium]|nr:hypothetical protein [Bacteroidota bacterium]
MRTLRILVFACLLASGAGQVFAQPLESPDLKLSLLRGSWETHTYREKFRIAFLDDKRMVYDREPGEYRIDAMMLRIRTDNRDYQYEYALQNNKLVLSDVYGDKFELRHERNGIYEDKCVGEYFSEIDSSGCEEHLSLKDDDTFVLESQCPDPDSTKRGIVDIDRSEGVYRLENSLILLTFADGTVDQAIPRFRGEDGEIGFLSFHGVIFDRDGNIDFAYDPTRGYQPPLPCWDCPPPPCLNCGCVDCGDPGPPPGIPTGGGGGGSYNPPPTPTREHRETGTTRGNSEPSGNSGGGSRGQGTRTDSAPSSPAPEPARQTGSTRGDAGTPGPAETGSRGSGRRP